MRQDKMPTLPLSDELGEVEKGLDKVTKELQTLTKEFSQIEKIMDMRSIANAVQLSITRAFEQKKNWGPSSSINALLHVHGQEISPLERSYLATVSDYLQLSKVPGNFFAPAHRLEDLEEQLTKLFEVLETNMSAGAEQTRLLDYIDDHGDEIIAIAKQEKKSVEENAKRVAKRTRRSGV